MTTMYKTATRCIAATVLFFALGNAQAALVSYEITGEVLSGEDFAPNVFGLTAGDIITATGIFDDAVLTGGAGTVSFASGSGNSMTISVGIETFTAVNDVDFGTGGGPAITLSSLTTLTDFDFQAFLGTNGAPADFNSSFTSFDDFDQMIGDWTAITTQVVPVPAAVWLFGSGLVALGGVVRRRKV
jgi:hypothetical protein